MIFDPFPSFLLKTTQNIIQNQDGTCTYNPDANPNFYPHASAKPIRRYDDDSPTTTNSTPTATRKYDDDGPRRENNVVQTSEGNHPEEPPKPKPRPR